MNTKSITNEQLQLEINNLIELTEKAITEIESASNTKTLESIVIKYMGKNGKITKLAKDVLQDFK